MEANASVCLFFINELFLVVKFDLCTAIEFCNYIRIIFSMYININNMSLRP